MNSRKALFYLLYVIVIFSLSLWLPRIFGPSSPVPTVANSAAKEASAPAAKAKAVQSKRMQSVQPAASRRIDETVAGLLQRKGLTQERLVTDQEFLRRLYLDLAGRIPTHDEAVAFLDDSSADKRSALIDTLLASPAYVSHTYNFWADLLRAAPIRGDAGNYPAWIKDSIEQNKPYDQMARELLTAEGRLLDDGAVGYWVRDGGRILETAAMTAQVFLGTQLQCAQCHDHKFDKWKQKDFYQFAAFFGEVDTRGGLNMLADRNERKKLRELQEELSPQENAAIRRFLNEITLNVHTAERKSLRYPKDYAYANAKPNSKAVPEVIFGTMPLLSQYDNHREAFAAWLTDRNNPRFATVMANRIWKRLMGIAIHEPIDDFKDKSEAIDDALLAQLGRDFTTIGYDMREFTRILCNTRAYQSAVSASAITPRNYYAQARPLRRMRAEQLWDSCMTLLSDDVDERKLANRRQGAEMMAAMPDLSEMSAEKILESVRDTMKAKRSMMMEANRTMRKRRTKGNNGPFVARASEMRPGGGRDDGFLQAFGQSEREVINGSSIEPSIPQVLALMNGKLSSTLTQAKMPLMKTLLACSSSELADRLFVTLLSRRPTADERKLVRTEYANGGREGLQNLVWAILNSREFLFIQ